MIDENDGAVTGGESEVASTDLHSVIADAVETQRKTAEPAQSTKSDVSAEDDQHPREEEPRPREDGRDEKGRFAPKEPKAEAATEEPAAPVEAEADTPKEPEAPAHRPPPGWPVAAKAAYAELPDAVKDAIAKREEEVSAGFARYGGLKQYAEIAERNGTTLAQAVNDYAKIEDGLRRDFISGIDAINARFGVRPDQFIQAYAARHGVDLSGQQTTQAGYQPPPVNPDAIIQRATAAIEEKFAAREANAAIEKFKNDPQNQYYENVREDMSILLKSGKAQTLQEAYDRACWMHPEIRAILLKSQTQNTTPSNVAAIQKARAAAKAVGGAPSPGFKPDVKTVDTSKMSIMDNIRHAIAQQR